MQRLQWLCSDNDAQDCARKLRVRLCVHLCLCGMHTQPVALVRCFSPTLLAAVSLCSRLYAQWQKGKENKPTPLAHQILSYFCKIVRSLAQQLCASKRVKRTATNSNSNDDDDVGDVEHKSHLLAPKTSVALLPILTPISNSHSHRTVQLQCEVESVPIALILIVIHRSI